VSRFKIDGSGPMVVQRVFPAADAHAPFVARLESRESPLRTRRNEIISIEHREIEKFLCDLHADSMQTDIFRAGATKTVAIKSGQRVTTTTFQFRSQYIRWHERILTFE